MNWDDIQKPVTLLGALFALTATISGFYFAARRRFREKPRAKRIIDPGDEDLRGVWRIHREEFVGEVADEFQDLQRWLIEAAKARNSGSQKFDEFLLCVKASDQVLGYLFAQYYLDSKLIFISYVAIDRKNLTAKRRDSEVVVKLFYELMRQLKRRNYRWHGIVGELELNKMGKYYPHALILMTTFHLTLRSKKFASHFLSEPTLYRLSIDYKQPILRPSERVTAVLDGSYDQCLVFLPREQEKLVVRDSGATYLEKPVVIDVLKHVLLEVYYDAFEDDGEYKEYLESEFKNYVSKLPDKIRVTTEFKSHLENRKDKAKQLYGVHSIEDAKIAT